MKRAPLAQVGPNQPHVGWEVTQDEGGAWRIKPRQRSRPTMGLLLVAAGLGCCGFVWLLFVKLNRGGGDWRSLRLTMLLPLGLLLIGQGIRTAFGREEWLASADLLEVQWSVWGFRRTRRFRGATLGLVAATNSSASRTQRRLLRAARAGKRARDRAPDRVWLCVSDRHGKRCLASSAHNAARPEEVRALGELLSEHTGWPLRLPARRGRQSW